MSTKQKTYSNEFKEEAVKRVMSGIPASQVARELDINVNSLYTWKQRYMKHPEQPFVGSGKLHKEDEEKRQLRQRIKELEQKNEFLKIRLMATVHQRHTTMNTESPRTSSQGD